MKRRTLDTLRRVRERQRDLAHQLLAQALAAERHFDEQRRAWRGRVEAEAGAAADDPCGYGRWVDACRTQERLTEAQAQELKAKVRAAHEVYHLTDRAVEQVSVLAAEAHRQERRDALAREQRWLDDLKRGQADDSEA